VKWQCFANNPSGQFNASLVWVGQHEAPFTECFSGATASSLSAEWMYLGPIRCPCGKGALASLASEPRSLHSRSCAHRRPCGAESRGQLVRAYCMPGSGRRNRAYLASARTLPRRRCKFGLGMPLRSMIRRPYCSKEVGHRPAIMGLFSCHCDSNSEVVARAQAITLTIRSMNEMAIFSPPIWWWQGSGPVGSEEARLRAGLRPPLKLHVRFSRMQLSRRHT
jgi:hypothetical protein